MGRPAEKHSDLPERPQAPLTDAEARARQALRGPANVMETVGGLYFILCSLALLGSGLRAVGSSSPQDALARDRP